MFMSTIFSCVPINRNIVGDAVGKSLMVKDLPRLSFRLFGKRYSHAFFVLSGSEWFRALPGFVVTEFRRARLNKRVLAFTSSWQALTLGSAVVDRRR